MLVPDDGGNDGDDVVVVDPGTGGGTVVDPGTGGGTGGNTGVDNSGNGAGTIVVADDDDGDGDSLSEDNYGWSILLGAGALAIGIGHTGEAPSDPQVYPKDGAQNETSSGEAKVFKMQIYGQPAFGSGKDGAK